MRDTGFTCRLPKETRTITYVGEDPEKIADDYKASLVAEFGASEEAQKAGLKKVRRFHIPHGLLGIEPGQLYQT
jgi:hypothetical protein